MKKLLAFVFLFSFACNKVAEPLPDLSGRWAAPASVPGSSLAFTLSQVADSLHGSGTYAIEAGRAGTLAVQGMYARPAIQLTLVYDFGQRLDFAGKLAGSQMVGTITDDAGQARSFRFVKQ